MTDLVSHLASGFAFIALAVAVALGSYGLMRFAAVHLIEDKTQDLAGSVTFRVAALHSMILALVFAQEVQNTRDIRAGLVVEATAVTDLFYDIDRYGAPDGREMRLVVAQYAHSVVTEDWPSLDATGRLSASSYIHWEAIYQSVLNLVPENPRQEALRSHMLDRVHVIAEQRQARVNAANNAMAFLFWLATAGGVIFISVPYFVYPPRPLNITLIIIFASYTGLILFTIYALSDPFSYPAAIRATPFLNLMDGEIGQWITGVPDG